MRKIKATTEKIVVCEIDYSESTLRSDKVLNFAKEQNLLPDYDEVEVNAITSTIKLLKYTHIFAVEV